MSSQNKLPGAQVGPFLTLGVIVFVALILLFGFSFLTQNKSRNRDIPPIAAASAPTGVSSPPTGVSPNENGEATASQTAVTEVSPTAIDEATSTPQVVMGVPNEVTPAPTYAIGPTAQFTELLPLSEWHSYEDTVGGFSIQYPPDWYIHAIPEEQRITGSTTSLYSYDPNDPNLDILGKSGNWPTNFTKIEITLDRPELTGHPWNADETISEWVHESTPLMDDVTMLQERTTFIDGIEAFQQVTQAGNQHPWSVTHLHVGDYILYIAYPYEGGESFNSQVLDRIVNSIHIRR